MESAGTQQEAGRPLWLWLTAAIWAVVVLLDLVLTADAVLIGLLAVPPLVASLRCSPSETLGVGVGSLGAAAALGAADGIFGSTDHMVRLITVALAGGLAVAVASLRLALERRAERARASAGRHAAVADSALDCLISIDHEGRVLEWNPAAQVTFGYTREQALGHELAELVVPARLRDRHRAGLRRYLETGSSRILDKRIELTALRSNGSEFPVELTVTRIRGREPPVFIGFVRDITERRRLRERLSHQAMHDALTGLPNRALLMDRLALAVRRLRRSGAVAAVLFIDLDRFKSVNDSLGHAAGDELLVTVARRFRRVMRPEDTIGRMSGDEFCAICEGLISEDQASLIAGRLVRAFEAPVEIAGRKVASSASIGVVTATGEGETAEGLLSAADAAMYGAKQEGGARYMVFDEGMRSRAGERMKIESELRDALEREELTVFYQPQIDLRTGEPVGLEALVRWRHPQRGLLQPAQFIDVAEESGLIEQLGARVLEQACLDFSSIESRRRERLRTMSVNLSAVQFASPRLAEMVAGVLERCGVEPPTLCLEITETTLVTGAAATSDVLSALQELGVRLAIDDFGTGYSSLGYLRRLPVDQLKVDRSFIEGLGSRDDDRAIVSAVVNMGHSLGLSVLAEGVETDEQLSELRSLGCDLGQGYRFARPRPATELEELFGSRAAV